MLTLRVAATMVLNLHLISTNKSMMQRRILLVDDDFLSRRLTKKVLAENNFQVIEAKNAKEAMEILARENIDIALLDIHLGASERDGISLARELESKFPVPFIYLTAYDHDDIVARALATTPHSYITKPFKSIDLLTSIELAIRHAKQTEKPLPTISVKDGEYNLMLSVQDVHYIEADGNYLLVHTDSNNYKTRTTIRQMLDFLPPNMFVQTHRAFLVNKAKIDKFSLKSLVVKDRVIPVSKNYIDDTSSFTLD